MKQTNIFKKEVLTMANKKTQRDYFNMLLTFIEVHGGDSELTQFCNERIEALNKKTASRKPSATQEANETLKQEILSILDTKEGKTIPEIKEASQTMKGESPQKMSALLRMMYDCENPTVKREKDGKVTKFIKIA